MKAEVARLEGRSPRDNARFDVTNLRCTRSLANQLRLLQTAAAYVLFPQLRVIMKAEVVAA